MEQRRVPAFPIHPETAMGNQLISDSQGMTLRDYFAAQAISGFLANMRSMNHGFEEMANYSYEIADLMLKARDEE